MGANTPFATAMAETEHPGVKNVDNVIAARARVLHRIEDGETGVSPGGFQDNCRCSRNDDFGTSKVKYPRPTQTARRPMRWVRGSPTKRNSPNTGGLITATTILSKTLITFGCINLIDFSAPHKGCLYTLKNYGIERPIYYKVYGYLFREMLVAITQGDDERNQLESVAIYHDFRRPIREHVGHFAIRVNEDWNGDFGAGASILLRQPLPGTEKEGRQSPAMCKKLTEYWKQLGGERCNRLLSLFGHAPFSASQGGDLISRTPRQSIGRLQPSADAEEKWPELRTCYFHAQ